MTAKVNVCGVPMLVNIHQVAWDVEDPEQAYYQIEFVTHRDSLSVASHEDHADECEEAMTRNGFAPSNRRPIYAVSGIGGDILREVRDED